MKNTINYNLRKKFKKLLIIISLLFIYILISAFSYSSAVSNSIRNSVFRLHVIANSDSLEDQNLKYLIRNDVLAYINNICQNITLKEDIILKINEHSEDIKTIAKNTIINQGFDYDVNINIGNFDFPTKTYGDVSLPAGFYDALRIEIGEGIGQNWWCVIFPQLCFIDVDSTMLSEDSKQLLSDNLSSEEYDLISSNTSEVKLKFKIVEMFQGINTFFAKK